MKGRLEHALKEDAYAKKILEGLPSEVQQWYLNLSVSMEPKSSGMYVVYLRLFSNFMGNPESLKGVTDTDVQRFMKSIETKTVNGEIVATSFSYRKTVHSALNNFFTYMVKKKWMDSNPMEMIRRARQKDNVNRVYLTDDDLKKIIEATMVEPLDDYQRVALIRDRAILRVFMATGVRETALTEINIEDINFDKSELYIVDKGNKTHTHILGPKTIIAIKEWLAVRGEWANENSGSALFISTKGNRVVTRWIHEIVGRYTELGIGKRLSPHKLRAAYGTILYNKTKDIRFVQERMGHASVTTTQLYVVTDNTAAEKAAKIMDI